MDSLKNLIITGLTLAVVVLLGGAGYIYATKDIVPKNKASNNYAEDDNIVFENLPPSIQDRYIAKSVHIAEIERVESQKEQLAQEITELANDDRKKELLQKTALMQKDLDEQIIDDTKQRTMENTSITDRTKFKTYTCKSFVKGSIVTPSSCKKELYQFLDKHKEKAKEFEVIGMVDKTEFKLIQNLEDVYGSSEVKEVKKYVQIGLSRQRVIEVTWLARQYLPKNTPIGAVNYTVYSNNKRGFVIRAYF